jgi:hypothetical protein
LSKRLCLGCEGKASHLTCVTIITLLSLTILFYCSWIDTVLTARSEAREEWGMQLGHALEHNPAHVPMRSEPNTVTAIVPVGGGDVKPSDIERICR